MEHWSRKLLRVQSRVLFGRECHFKDLSPRGGGQTQPISPTMNEVSLEFELFDSEELLSLSVEKLGGAAFHTLDENRRHTAMAIPTLQSEGSAISVSD
jgi:hypothetical protein